MNCGREEILRNCRVTLNANIRKASTGDLKACYYVDCAFLAYLIFEQFGMEPFLAEELKHQSKTWSEEHRAVLWSLCRLQYRLLEQGSSSQKRKGGPWLPLLKLTETGYGAARAVMSKAGKVRNGKPNSA
ncbi:MAG: hypothetical protein LBP22_08740 [Deltaproteobacteria bacterium]|jgi:hypothetical protein|nr:hypothetical protein [Deltaproteobacteria bacterium]